MAEDCHRALTLARSIRGPQLSNVRRHDEMRSVATVSHAEAPSMCAAKAAKPLSSPLRSVAETKAVGKDGANLGAVDRRWEQKTLASSATATPTSSLKWLCSDPSRDQASSPAALVDDAPTVENGNEGCGRYADPPSRKEHQCRGRRIPRCEQVLHRHHRQRDDCCEQCDLRRRQTGES